METNIEKMYMDLNELLQDICKFLTNDKLRVLLPKEKKLAESLIDRCKVQLHEISKVQQTPINNEYVDMNNKKVLVFQEEEDGKNNIYSSVDDSVHKETTLIEEVNFCPYKDLPAKDTIKKIKEGKISMRRRFLFIDKMKRVYAVIHHQWLLIYDSDKDLKPILMFDLKKCEAKADNQRSANFKLITTFPVQKIYYFMANTPKDMIQWLIQINKYSHNGTSPIEGLIEDEDVVSEEDDVSEHYDCVNPPGSYKPKETEEKYTGRANENLHLISEETLKRNQQNRYHISPPGEIQPRPALPGRIMKTRSIPVAPPVIKPLPLPLEKSDDEKSDDESSDVSYYDIDLIKNDQSNRMEDESCESDEDNTYEVFTAVKEDVKKLKTVRTEAARTQSLKEAPKVPVKPKVRPPVAKKPSTALNSGNSDLKPIRIKN